MVTTDPAGDLARPELLRMHDRDLLSLGERQVPGPTAEPTRSTASRQLAGTISTRPPAIGVMAERKSLVEVKASRPWTPAMQADYEQAGAAYELGERVRVLREEAGLSQRELASRMGTTQSAIARLEAGGAEPTVRDHRSPA